MTKTLRFAYLLNFILLTLLVIAVAGFLSYANVYGFFLALVTSLIAWGVFKRNRWGYFSAAAWGLACYQLAKQGYEFHAIKRQAMILGFCVIPTALFLHEMLAKVPLKSAEENAKNDPSGRNTPD